MLLGAHVSSAGGIDKAVDRIEAMGGEALQVFTQSSRTWRQTNHDPANFERFKKRRQEAHVQAVVCHAVYLINLCSPDAELYEKSTRTLLTTIEVAQAIDADGVVLHVGSHLGSGFEAGLERAIPALKRALERCRGSTLLLLENSAGAGGTVGRSIEELASFVDRLDAHPQLGICLDSCHLWVSGIDVTDRTALDAMLDEIEGRIGLERLNALHVNDAGAALGSNRDRHANIGEGEMGDALGAFVSHPKLQRLPALLETPGRDGRGPDVDELQKLRELHARWTGP